MKGYKQLLAIAYGKEHVIYFILMFKKTLKRNHKILFNSLLFVFYFGMLSAQSWEWGTSAGNTWPNNNSFFSNSVAADENGNSYIVGKFFGTIEFDTVSSFSGGGSFIAKYNSVGNFEWAKHIGPNPSDRGNDIATDVAGNVYVVGGINNDAFIGKYDSLGNEIWVVLGTGPGTRTAFAVDVDVNGNVYVTGRMDSEIDFGTVSSGPFSNSHFTAKLNTDGFCFF